MSWVEEETARIKREDERQKAARDWAIHKAHVLTQRAVELWSAIEDQVKKDLVKLNASFAEDQHRQLEFEEIPSFAFSLKKKSGQSLQIVVRMSTDGRALKIRVYEAIAPLGRSTEKERSIAIDLDEKENVFFLSDDVRIGSIEVVSHTIFEPFIRHFQTV